MGSDSYRWGCNCWRGRVYDIIYIFSQFSISRRQPSRFNCCKPSILIRTNEKLFSFSFSLLFLLLLFCCCFFFSLFVVCLFSIRSKCSRFHWFQLLHCKNYRLQWVGKAEGRRERARARARGRAGVSWAGYLTDCWEQWLKSFRIIKCVYLKPEIALTPHTKGA